MEKEPVRPSDGVARPEANAEIIATTNASRRATTSDKLSRLLRGDLDTIIVKALKKDPTERYTSVTALADDLRRYLRNEPINARPDTFAYRAAKLSAETLWRYLSGHSRSWLQLPASLAA